MMKNNIIIEKQNMRGIIYGKNIKFYAGYAWFC